jgi:hypothetical protein
MPKTICQTVMLSAPADMLFEMYLNPKTHTVFTGAPVTISAKPGSKFRAFGADASRRSKTHDRPIMASQPLEGR